MSKSVSKTSANRETHRKKNPQKKSPLPELKQTEGGQLSTLQAFISADSNPSEFIPGILKDTRLLTAQRQAIMSASETLSGNQALQRLIASMQSLDIQKSSPDSNTLMRQEVTPATSIRDSLLGLGIKEKEIGTPETLSEAEHYLSVLKSIIAKHKGIADILIRRWNNRADDLGIASDAKKKTQKPYDSVLHYLKELDRLSLASLDVTWEKAIPILSSSKTQISLAGAKFTVHPRALYFTAAAQVGMDIAAMKEADKGHYIAPGALYSEVHSIYNAASTVVKMSVINQEGGKTTVGLPMPNAVVLYKNLRDRLTYINNVVEAQKSLSKAATASGTSKGSLAEYHTEPILVAFFEKKDALKSLPGSAESGAKAVLLCMKIMETLKLGSTETKFQKGKKKKTPPSTPGEFLPKKVAGHGTWSFDPHSTSHALAVAIDLFTDRVRAVTNMGMPPAAKPFVDYLIQIYGQKYGLDPKKGYPGMNMNVAHLLREGQPTMDQIVGQTKDVNLKEMNKAIYQFDTLKNQIKQALQNRATTLGKVLKNKKWQAPGVYKAQLSIIKPLLSFKNISKLTQSPPKEMSNQLAHLKMLLDDAASTFPLPEGGAAISGVAMKIFEQIKAMKPDSQPSLIKLEAALAKLGEPAEKALSKKKLLKIKATLNPSVKQWIRTVSQKSSAAFDQPAELMEGIKRVKGARMMGPHHWEIGAFNVPKGELKAGSKKSYSFKDILTSEKAYKDLLLYDMVTHPLADMERILKTMCESSGGRQAIHGENGDVTFRQALNEWAAAKKVNLDDLLTKVISVEPSPQKKNPKLAKLIQDLYDRGYYELAKELEKPPINPEATKE